MNNTFLQPPPPPPPSSTRLDPLEQAKEALETSQRGLERETQRVATQLETLQQAQDLATKAVRVAEARLTTVIMVVEKLCDDCFHIMPLFSDNDVLAKMASSSTGDETTCGGCIACGQPLQGEMNLMSDVVELPPPPTLLQKARESLEYSNTVVDCLEQGHGLFLPEPATSVAPTSPRSSTFTPPRTAASTTMNHTTTTSGSASLDMEFLQSRMDYLESRFGRGLSMTHMPTLTNTAPSRSSLAPLRSLSTRDVHERIQAAMCTGSSGGGDSSSISTPTTRHATSSLGKSRQECVLAAEKAVVATVNRQQEINDAITMWKRYQQQLEEQLQEVQATATNLQLRARKTLQEKIDALGGTLSHRCIICEERGKDIVFQCGHRSCAPCGAAIVKCHTCRVTITQRIKIFD